MVSTRSKTAQMQLNDYGVQGSTPKTKGRQAASQKSPPKANTSKKRKPPETTESIETQKPAVKRSRTVKPPSNSNHTKTGNGTESSKIIINRAPVLQLWSACVTHHIYPSVAWETCLSAGSAISTICAVAKGRSIGTVPEVDGTDAKAKKRHDAKKKKQKDLDNMQVMQFKLKLQDGLAVVGSESKGKSGGEEPLKKKFGDEEYEKVRVAFEEALKSWDGGDEELNQRAFGFYEKFRPDVKTGQKGWGRKGVLDLEKVRSVVSK